MCWFCDHPGSPRSEYLDQLRRVIAGHGWAVQGIERDGIHPPWAYTVGLTAFGQPELVATGLPHQSSVHLLNAMGEHLLHALGIKLGESAELSDGQIIQFLNVAEPTAHLEMAVELFGPRIRALQVVHADDRGRWPWECGYRGVRGGQPILGPPTLPISRRPPEQRRAADNRPRQGPGRRRSPRSVRRLSMSHPPSRPQ